MDNDNILPNDTYNPPQWLINMPKSDLHCHLGGSLRLNTILDLAEKNKVDIGVKTIDELRAKIVYKNRSNPSLAGYIKGIALCEKVLTTPESFTRCAFEVSEDAAKENVKLFELRFGPTNYITPTLKPYQIMESVLEGLKLASEKYNMYTGLIVCGIRTDMVATREAVQLAINYQNDGVVGIDLAGKENGYRPKNFRDIFMPALKNFIPRTIHAGEEDSAESIAEALTDLNATRIGHAIPVSENTNLFNHMSTVRTGIEAIVTGNVDTGAIPTLRSHPIRNIYKNGLRVFPNTDNRTISDTNITNEYCILLNELGFTQSDVYHLARHAIHAAFIKDADRKPYLEALAAYAIAYPAPI